jgi:hypothetical protein
MGFTFGSDPEFLLMKGGKYYSAIGIVKGDRQYRLDMGGHQFYYDNVLAECAIKPGKNRAEVLKNFQDCFTLYTKMVKPYKLHIQASQEFPESQMQTKEAREVGCVEEWDAYTLQVIEPPKGVIKKSNFRTAGGHIHLGGGGVLQNSWEKPFVVYMLDLFLGIPSVFMEQDKTSKDRRSVYGLAGSHREKDYGLEYRPLSAFWLESPRQVGLVWDICDFVLHFVNKGGYRRFWELNEELLEEDDPSVAYRCFGYDKAALQKAINTCDKELAGKFMIIVEQFMPADLFRRVNESQESQGFYTEWGLD